MSGDSQPDRVLGLWHRGVVTAACLRGPASTWSRRPRPRDRRALAEDRPPVGEPGLAERIAAGHRGRPAALRRRDSDASTRVDGSLGNLRTRFDEEDRADSAYVLGDGRCSPTAAGTLVSVSSMQLRSAASPRARSEPGPPGSG